LVSRLTLIKSFHLSKAKVLLGSSKKTAKERDPTDGPHRIFIKTGCKRGRLLSIPFLEIHFANHWKKQLNPHCRFPSIDAPDKSRAKVERDLRARSAEHRPTRPEVAFHPMVSSD
jgi:hypothetical protein